MAYVLGMPAALADLDVLAVIAEPTRRRILDALRDGERSVGELVDELALPQPGVSRHLRVLREAGLADVRPDAATDLQRNEVTGMLEKAMHQLPEQQRIAVIFSYHEDMSNSEIAEVMNTTVSAVESLLKRGRQQLKTILRRHERDIRQSFTD